MPTRPGCGNACGAIGSGTWLDAVDVADLLLEVLRPEMQLSQPVLDHLQRFERDHVDACAVLEELLRLQHYELGLNSFQQDSKAFLCACLWVRRRAA